MRALARLLGGGGRGRALVIAGPYLWFTVFFLVPFIVVLMISLSTAVVAIPPYKWLVTWLPERIVGV